MDGSNQLDFTYRLQDAIVKYRLPLAAIAWLAIAGCSHIRTASFPESDSITQIVIKDMRTSDAPHLHTIKDSERVAAITTLLDNYKEGWKPYRLVGPKSAPIELRMYHNQRMVQIVRWGNGELLTGIDKSECHRPLSAADEKQLLAVLKIDGAAPAHDADRPEAVATKPSNRTEK